MATRYDFYSDTLTKPTEEMRKYMCSAEVGDEQRLEDPTTNRLQDMVAELLNKEAGLFVPSGTMANEVSFLSNCHPGDEIIMDISAHPYHAEGGAPAALGGITTRPVLGDRGIFTGAQVEEAIRPPHRLRQRSRLVSVEQPTNITGGHIWQLDKIEDVVAMARKYNLYAHMDGARIFNASIVTGIPVSKYAGYFDTTWVDFSKGLGAPVGAVVVGSKEFIEEAWRWKQRLGGAMRQSGILAAACIYALEHHVDRLAEDHENAKYLAHRLCEIPKISINPDMVETNIVTFDISQTGKPAALLATEFIERDVRFSIVAKTKLRAVAYLGITQKHIDEALKIVRDHLSH